MGKNRLRRKLDPARVDIALRTQKVKHALAMNMILERVKIDPEFAKDVLYIGGEQLREDVKLAAQETLKNNEQSKNPIS